MHGINFYLILVHTNDMNNIKYVYIPLEYEK